MLRIVCLAVLLQCVLVDVSVSEAGSRSGGFSLRVGPRFKRSGFDVAFKDAEFHVREAGLFARFQPRRGSWTQGVGGHRVAVSLNAAARRVLLEVPSLSLHVMFEQATHGWKLTAQHHHEMDLPLEDRPREMAALVEALSNANGPTNGFRHMTGFISAADASHLTADLQTKWPPTSPLAWLATLPLSGEGEHRKLLIAHRHVLPGAPLRFQARNGDDSSEEFLLTIDP